MAGIIKHVAIAGGSGHLGSVVFRKLVECGKFNVRVLRRAGSTSKFPESTDVVDVDFDSLESLQSALAGQQAVVSTLGASGIGQQGLLVDAAVNAGVSRFLPSEFGSDLDNPKTRQLPVYVAKVKVEDYLIEKAKTTGLTYTFVYNNAFLDLGLQQDFILRTSDGKPMLLDGGDLPFSTTFLASVGDAVVGVLTHPDETKNRSVYVHDFVTTQNQLLTLAKQAAPAKAWEPTVVKLDELIARSDAKIAQKMLDRETVLPYLLRAIMGPGYGGAFATVDNELLGLKERTKEDILEIFRELLK
jgi:uncharacterized protein YbjT (DUF2867 family)